MIILNYQEYCDDLRENGFKKFSTIRDLKIMAKIMAKSCANEEELKHELLCFCEKVDKNFNFIKDSKKVGIAIKERENGLKQLKETITFTKNEMKKIKSIGNYDEEKFLFVLMTVCKTYSSEYIFLNSLSPIKIKDILEMAKINVSTSKGEKILHDLYAKKMIDVAPNLKYSVLALDNSTGSEIAFELKPSKKCINIFETYNGKGIYCNSCGEFVKKRSNNTKYCPICAKKIKKEQDIARMRKISKVEN